MTNIKHDYMATEPGGPCVHCGQGPHSSTLDITSNKVMRELAGCPLCGASPHQGLGKIQHDQLHGEPFQMYSIWCPTLHVKVTRVNREQATEEWNHRPLDVGTLRSPAAFYRARQTLAGAGIEDILKEQVNDKSRYLNPSHAGGVVERFDAWLDNEWDRKYKALTVKDRALLKEVRAALAGAREVVETDELVEKVARAIWGRSPYWTWDEGDEESQERCRVQARAAIRAMLSYAPSVPKSSEVQK